MYCFKKWNKNQETGEPHVWYATLDCSQTRLSLSTTRKCTIKKHQQTQKISNFDPDFKLTQILAHVRGHAKASKFDSLDAKIHSFRLTSMAHTRHSNPLGTPTRMDKAYTVGVDSPIASFNECMLESYYQLLMSGVQPKVIWKGGSNPTWEDASSQHLEFFLSLSQLAGSWLFWEPPPTLLVYPLKRFSIPPHNFFRAPS